MYEVGAQVLLKYDLCVMLKEQFKIRHIIMYTAGREIIAKKF